MKKQIYLFDESSRGSAYGIGTYIWQLIVCLTGVPEIALHVVHIGADVEHFERKEMPGYDLYSIPQFCIPMTGKTNFYQRNICYLIRLHADCTANDELIFMFNYSHHLPLIRLLKESFPDGRFYFAIHYQDWCFGLNGDVAHLKQIMHTEDPSALSTSEQTVYHSFLLDKEIYQVVDKVICLSGFTLSLLNESYGIPWDKLTLIYNGLKDERKLLTTEERNLLKKRFHFSPKEKIILFAGRLDGIKGVETLLLSFRELLRRKGKYRLVIAGEGDFSSCLAKCGTDWSKITFTGRLNKELLYDFYQIADIGVMPSMHEQCSYVTIEMMMFGLPMVVSTTTGLREMMQEGGFGYNFDMEKDNEASANKLADLITKVLEAPLMKRKKMKRLSRSSYEEKYTAQAMGKKYLNLLLKKQ